jgi:hypothetical protein
MRPLTGINVTLYGDGMLQWSQQRPVVSSEKNLITFWEEAVQNGLASAKTGKVEFDKVLFLKISVPGDKSEAEYEVERHYPEGYPHPSFGKVKKNEVIYKRFGREIEDYKAKMGSPEGLQGTPIEEWALVDVRIAAHLKYNGVATVEALALVSDGNAQKMGPGIRQLVEKAKDWLANAASAADAMALQDENRKLQSQIDELTERFNSLGSAMDALPEEAKTKVREEISKRGRKAAA